MLEPAEAKTQVLNTGARFSCTGSGDPKQESCATIPSRMGSSALLMTLQEAVIIGLITSITRRRNLSGFLKIPKGPCT